VVQNRTVLARFDIYVFITITAGGLFVTDSIIRLEVVSGSTLIWFIRYNYYWNLVILLIPF